MKTKKTKKSTVKSDKKTLKNVIISSRKLDEITSLEDIIDEDENE